MTADFEHRPDDGRQPQRKFHVVLVPQEAHVVKPRGIGAFRRAQPPSFTIRGVGVTNEFAASTASAVGVYVDDVYQTFRASHGQQLFDLEQIEILRGPQGTLFGKNGPFQSRRRRARIDDPV